MKIPKRIALSLINTLKGGVVPRVGLPYIAVGREAELTALLNDIDLTAEGGASFRFVVGKYGSGKSFLLQTVRNYAMDKNFITADADLSPERRLCGNKGQGLATYRELIGNLSTKMRPEGGALPLILDRWINAVQSKISANFTSNDPEAVREATARQIRAEIAEVRDLVHGYDFALLLTRYYEAYIEADDDTKAKILKWFKGEYTTKTEAKSDLGVYTIINDENWYDYLKVFAGFFRSAGYGGLLILVDELVNIYKLPQSISRQYNYEKILTMYNDTLQGKAPYLSIIMSGTPQCVEDTRRGIYSYEALRSRLAEGKFSSENLRDMLSPVIKLAPLTSEEMLVLTEKLTLIHSSLFDYSPDISREELVSFIKTEYARIGAESNITPREVIRDFIELLNITYQNPNVRISDILSSDKFSYATGNDGEADDDFSEFEI